MKRIVTVFTLSLLFLSSPLRAALSDIYHTHERDLPQFASPLLKEASQKFLLDQALRPDQEKIQRMRQKSQIRKKELVSLLERTFLADGKDLLSAQKKARKNDRVLAADTILRNLDELSSIERLGMGHEQVLKETVRLCQRILLLEESFIDNDEQSTLNQVLGDIRVILREKHEVSRDLLKGELATNLLHPQHLGRYLTKEELETRIRQGQDISQLDPPHTTFWRKPQEIAQTDLSKDLDYGFSFEPGTEFSFDESVEKGHNPKLKVKHRGAQVGPYKITSWRLKLDDEVNVEIASSRIMRLVGYPAPLFYYVKFPKVYFKTDREFTAFKKNFTTFYGGERQWNRLVAKTARDSRGPFVVFHEASARANLPHEKNLGPFHWNFLGHYQRREVRGQVLIQAFLGNSNIKEAHNNKIKLVSGGDWEFSETTDSSIWELISGISDVGTGFGDHLFKNNPNFFSHAFIDPQYQSAESPVIKLNYRRYHMVGEPNPFTHNHYSDLKWMARYLAQMTPQQLRFIIQEAHWPRPLQGLIFEKISHRRNDMVRAFELEKEGIRPWKTAVPWPSSELKGFTHGDFIRDGKLLKNFQDRTDYFPVNYLKSPRDFLEYVHLSSSLEPEENFSGIRPGSLKTLYRDRYHHNLRTHKVVGLYLGSRADGSRALIFHFLQQFKNNSPQDLKNLFGLLGSYTLSPLLSLTPELYNDTRYGDIKTKVTLQFNEKGIQCLTSGRGCALPRSLIGSFMGLTDWIFSEKTDQEAKRMQTLLKLVGKDNVLMEVEMEGEFLPLERMRSVQRGSLF